MRHSMYMIEEYIENDDLKLNNTKCTTIILNKGGDDFFMAHVEDKERYSRVKVDICSGFIRRTIKTVRQRGLTGAADRLQKKKKLV